MVVQNPFIKTPTWYDVLISNTIPWIVDRKGYRYVYIYSRTSFTIVFSDEGVLVVPANMPTFIAYREGIQATCPINTQLTKAGATPLPIKFTAYCTDEIIQPPSVITSTLRIAELGNNAYSVTSGQLSINASPAWTGMIIYPSPSAPTGVAPTQINISRILVSAASGTVVNQLLITLSSFLDGRATVIKVPSNHNVLLSTSPFAVVSSFANPSNAVSSPAGFVYMDAKGYIGELLQGNIINIPVPASAGTAFAYVGVFVQMSTSGNECRITMDWFEELT